MSNRPRVAIGVDPFFVRSAVHRALSEDPRIDAFLLPRTPNARLQARHVEADAIVTSHPTSREGLPVLVVYPDGSVEASHGTSWRRVETTGIPQLADLIVEEVGRARARRRHPALIAKGLPVALPAS
jgi:(2Fe-2S) ferredoxin